MLLFVWSWAGVAYASSGSGMGWLNEGKNAEKDRDDRRASTAYNRAAGFADTHEEAIVAEARMLMRDGGPEQAFELLSKLVKEDSPFNVDARLALVEVLHVQKKYDAAIQLITSIEHLQPGNVPARAEKGLIFFDMKKADEAVAFLTKSLNDNPDASVIRIKRAQAYIQLGGYEKAIDDYEIVAKQRPEDTEIQMFLADAYFMSGKFQKAADVYGKVTHFNSTLSMAWEKCGDSLQKLNRLKDSQEFYKKASELEPNRFEAGQKLANVYIQIGLKPKAEDEYHRELSIDSGNDVATRGLVALLEERHDVIGAGKYLRELTEFHPEKVWASLRYAKLLTDLGNIDYAERVAKANIKAAGEPAETLVVLAQIKCDQNKRADGFKILQEAEKKYPTDAGVKFTMASFYAQDGKNAEAVGKYHEVEGDTMYGTQAREKIASIQLQSGSDRIPAALTAPVKSEDLH